MIITMDGLGGTGKSSQSRELARKINFKSFDTGAVYRTITLKLIQNNVDPRNIDKLIKLLNDTEIEVDEQIVTLDNIDVSNRIRQMDITLNSAYIATIKEVKEKVIQIQRDFGNANNVVMDGRDIGTRIFPNAEIKFYLEASPEVRAKRKFLEGKDKDLSYKDILKKLLERDKIEIASKSILIPKDAFKINTDNMTFEEVSEKLIQITMQKMNVIER